MRSTSGALLRALRLYPAYERWVFGRRLKNTSMKLHKDGVEVTIRTHTQAAAVLTANFLKNESDILDFFFSHLKSGDTFWDIGANIGIFSIFCAKRVGKEGEVYAFEPEQRTFTELLKNVDENGLCNVIPKGVAIGEEDGEAMLHASADTRNQGVHSLVQRGDYPLRQQGVAVPVLRGDTYARDASVRRPSVVKIDVEGAEFSVLRGMREVLSAPEVRALCVELHPLLLEDGKRAVETLRGLLEGTALGIERVLERGTEIHCFCRRVKE